MAINDQITGQDAYNLMLMLESASSNIRYHFNTSSKLWRAIRKHIESDNCSLILKPDNIVTYRGTGDAIYLIKVSAYHNQYEKDPKTNKTIVIEPNCFYMEIEIAYYNDECETFENETFVLKPPIDLLIDFEQEKFDAWVKIQSITALDTACKNATEVISKILSRLPKESAKSVLNELTLNEFK